MRLEYERVPVDAAHSFAAFRYATSHIHHALHVHDEVEIAYVVRAKGIVYCGSRTTPFADGDLFLMGSRVAHRFEGRTVLPHRTAVATVVQFRADLYGGGFLDLPENAALRALIDAAAVGLKAERVAAGVSRQLSGLIRSRATERHVRLLTLLSTLCDLDWVRLSSGPIDERSGARGIDRLHRLQAYVEANYRDRIDPVALASQIGLSRVAMCRYVRRVTRMSLTELVNDYRLLQAAEQLRETDRTVAGVALDSGFTSLSYFNRRFRERFGQTPTAYRAAWSG